MIFCMPHIIIYFWIMFAPPREEFAFWECVCSIGVYFTEWEYVCNNSEGSCNSKFCCTRKGSWILIEGPMKVESLIFRWYLRDKFMFVENFVVFVQKERWLGLNAAAGGGGGKSCRQLERVAGQWRPQRWSAVPALFWKPWKLFNIWHFGHMVLTWFCKCWAWPEYEEE